MSTLKAARADNMYYPPDHDPAKGSLNKQQGTHALRGRASRLASHGILTVRFELPFPVWCGRCGHLMGKGVRFNADKRAAGTYHTTTVWRFEMATPCCSNKLIIRADPAARDFVVEDGGARKVVRDAGMEAAVDGDDTSGRAVFASRSERAAARGDPFRMLELETADAAAGADVGRRLVSLARSAAARGRDDYGANRAARDAARPARRAADADRVRGAALGLGVPLLPASAGDAAAAAAVIGTRDGVRGGAGGGVAARAAALRRRAAAAKGAAGGGVRGAVVVKRRGGKRR